MTNIKFSSGENIPLEMHKVRMVQKINLLPVEQRLRSMAEASHLHTTVGALASVPDTMLNSLTDLGDGIEG